MLIFDNVSYTYRSVHGDRTALRNLSARIKSGRITAVTGRSGSGKSTFISVAAGLTAADHGTVTFRGRDIAKCRADIGVMFQDPEHQLFADTVYEDIAFSPSRRGLRGKELKDRVTYAAKTAGVGNELFGVSPFALSGGEKRRVAFAGVIAAAPSLLLLDEPASALDGEGRRRLFSVLRDMADKDDITVVFVTHSMNDAAEYADDMAVIDGGAVKAIGSVRGILSRQDIPAPDILRLANELRSRSVPIPDMFTVRDAFEIISSMLHTE